MSGHDDDALISAHRVAKRLGAKRHMVYEWANPSKTPHPIPKYRVGKNGVRFKWREVVEWLASRRSAPLQMGGQ